MQTDGLILKAEDAGGVCPLLIMMSGYVAMERGSDSIDLRDLVKAIYIIDLEHVSNFWKDWEGFERFVISEKSGNGISPTYINRNLYLIRLELASRESPGFFIGMGRASGPLREVVNAARKLASAHKGAPVSPSSPDLLFSACSYDSELGKALQSSGLQLDKLAAAVSIRADEAL